jgi:nucleoside-diphosphate-sugar epimerase
VVKTLWHDEDVQRIVAVGSGTAPRAFDRFLAGSKPRMTWVRVDLARHRSVSDLFRSSAVRESRVDTVVHLPTHLAATVRSRTSPGGVARRTAEARLVLQHALDARGIAHLVALGSAFVYRLAPGNANRLSEQSALDLDPEVAPELRVWTDCDMTFHAEIGNTALRVVLLRVPAVAAAGGAVFLHPLLEGATGLRVRPAGFDPMCAVIADKDVARAVRAAVHTDHAGVYNVASEESLPLSVLARWARRPMFAAPAPLVAAATRLASATGTRWALLPPTGSHARFGFTLDTRRAERDLGFRPGYRVGLGRGVDGRPELETPAI